MLTPITLLVVSVLFTEPQRLPQSVLPLPEEMGHIAHANRLPQSTLAKRLPQSVLAEVADAASAPRKYVPELPAGAVEYRSDGWTQEIAVTNGFDRITPVPISHLEAKWHGSGGLVGLRGWKSKKYRVIPEGKKVATWIDNIQVLNSSGYYQPNRGIKRAYPDGTEFHDILTNDTGEIFEHRVRKKENGQWESSVEYSDEKARPPGYRGLKVSCNSCHNEAGTGGYATGLVPGGDTVLSDPLDWGLIGMAPRAAQMPQEATGGSNESGGQMAPAKAQADATGKPAQPEGEGWQWDERQQVWWRELPMGSASELHIPMYQNRTLPVQPQRFVPLRRGGLFRGGRISGGFSGGFSSGSC